MEGNQLHKNGALLLLLGSCAREGRAFWGWEHGTWCRVLGKSQADFLSAHVRHGAAAERNFMVGAAYLLRCFFDIRALGPVDRVSMARKVFGRVPVDATIKAVEDALAGCGYSHRSHLLRTVLVEILLAQGDPRLRAANVDMLQEMYDEHGLSPHRTSTLWQVGRALYQLGMMDRPLQPRSRTPTSAPMRGIAPEWGACVTRWESTSTVSPGVRRVARIVLLKAGRWLAECHPEVTHPQMWTREIAADYVAAVLRMRVGDYVEDPRSVHDRAGNPLRAGSKVRLLVAMRRFFLDAQEWGWITRRFNPVRAFATPRSLQTLIGPDPRTISDDIWAKLLWAGLNLNVADIPKHGRQPSTGGGYCYYPVEMLRALAVTWLFTGLRRDEICRLRVGCARMLLDVATQAPGTEESNRPVCLLDVPVHKTGRAFTKPVDVFVGKAIADWEAVRPAQPDMLDQKTGELVQFLFAYRARQISKNYINHSLIPSLCRKAGVPRADARGPISSHRARSTIASQLANAREPMSLFDLQQWLGHRHLTSTQHYVATTSARLTRAYQAAGYFARNVRAIGVLIDQEAVRESAAANGEPWRYYDLGHGYCSYEFFDQCPHRMACARCDFYIPKQSAHAQLLESKRGLLRLIQEIPLSDDERAAVDGDMEAMDRLLSKLSGTPTPTGNLPPAFVPLTDLQQPTAGGRGRWAARDDGDAGT